MTFSLSNSTSPEFLCLINPPNSSSMSKNSQQQLKDIASKVYSGYKEMGNDYPDVSINHIVSKQCYFKYALILIMIVFVVSGVGFIYGLNDGAGCYDSHTSYTVEEARRIRRTYRKILYTIAISMVICALALGFIIFFL